jgi:chromosome segregation ATPase
MPRLARLEAESLAYSLATQREFKEYRESLKTFAEAAAKLSAVSDQFPDLVATERQAAIEQAMDRLFDERENLIAEIDEREDSLKELLNQIRETLVVGESLSGNVADTITTVDSLVTRLGLDKPRMSDGGFRIEDYQATLVEATVTAGEIDKVLQSLERLLAVNLDKQGTPPVTWALQEMEERVERWIWLEFFALAALVLFTAVVVVVSSLLYRRLLSKFSGS